MTQTELEFLPQEVLESVCASIDDEDDFAALLSAFPKVASRLDRESFWRQRLMRNFASKCVKAPPDVEAEAIKRVLRPLATIKRNLLGGRFRVWRFRRGQKVLEAIRDSFAAVPKWRRQRVGRGRTRTLPDSDPVYDWSGSHLVRLSQSPPVMTLWATTIDGIQSEADSTWETWPKNANLKLNGFDGLTSVAIFEHFLLFTDKKKILGKVDLLQNSSQRPKFIETLTMESDFGFVDVVSKGDSERAVVIHNFNVYVCDFRNMVVERKISLNSAFDFHFHCEHRPFYRDSVILNVTVKENGRRRRLLRLSGDRVDWIDPPKNGSGMTATFSAMDVSLDGRAIWALCKVKSRFALFFYDFDCDRWTSLDEDLAEAEEDSSLNWSADAQMRISQEMSIGICVIRKRQSKESKIVGVRRSGTKMFDFKVGVTCEVGVAPALAVVADRFFLAHNSAIHVYAVGSGQLLSQLISKGSYVDMLLTSSFHCILFYQSQDEEFDLYEFQPHPVK